jgi:hypothetical protein
MVAQLVLSDKFVSVAPFQIPTHLADDPVVKEYTAFFRFARLVGHSRTG